ncbi:TPA: BglII/BstYI family type II restriction endonuclease [Pseudomonas aeruginosa]|uniref:BglII/BstYI family type II restriction endonuclease n=1 Tax=Stutzerimonas nitrititolerans TaxID=2482751 RepID=UPI0028AF4577|nr:BglII/BstYI family type II restriction endonuclease [Stutzerimonas nitrititolerans]
MAIDSLPSFIKENYQHLEVNHATAILKNDFPSEWADMVDMLTNFRLRRSEVLAPGGRKTTIASQLDERLYALGWEEKQFRTSIIIDGHERHTPTHKIDCYKNRVAIEIEWNNKDPFFDRDLNNFRLLFERNAISVGVIITRSTELQDIFNSLGKGASYGSSTTHWQKLIPRIHGGGAGGCPVLALGITKSLYDETC